MFNEPAPAGRQDNAIQRTVTDPIRSPISQSAVTKRSGYNHSTFQVPGLNEITWTKIQVEKPDAERTGSCKQIDLLVSQAFKADPQRKVHVVFMTNFTILDDNSRVQIIITPTVETHEANNKAESKIRHIRIRIRSGNKTAKDLVNLSTVASLTSITEAITFARKSDILGFAAAFSEKLVHPKKHGKVVSNDQKFEVLIMSLNFIKKHVFHNPKVIFDLYKEILFIKASPDCLSTTVLDYNRAERVSQFLQKRLAGSYTFALWSAFCVASITGHQIQNMFASPEIGLLATAIADYTTQTAIFLCAWVVHNRNYFFPIESIVDEQVVNPAFSRWRTLGQIVRSDLLVCTCLYAVNVIVCKALMLIPETVPSITYTSQLLNLVFYGTFALKNITACKKLLADDYQLWINARYCSKKSEVKINQNIKKLKQFIKNIGIGVVGFFVFQRFFEWATFFYPEVANAHMIASKLCIAILLGLLIKDMYKYSLKLKKTINSYSEKITC